jgi:hypothetical protein
MSVVLQERLPNKRAPDTHALATSPERVFEDLDSELAFLFEHACCFASVTTNGSACCASKALSHVNCCAVPE